MQTGIDVHNRYMRQLGILDPKVCDKKITIIGAGATGSFVALALGKMGMSNMTIYDADKIEEHNFPNQLFPVSMLARNKADATGELVRGFCDIDIDCKPEYFEDQDLEGVVICALDTMKGRKTILKNCEGNRNVDILIDPRCGPEVFRIYSVDPNMDIECNLYKGTLHSDEESDAMPCTSRTIIYSVLAVSSWVCKIVRQFLMNKEYSQNILVDMDENLLVAEKENQ